MLLVSVIKNHPIKLAYFFFEECGVILDKINKQIQTASTTGIDPENNIRDLYINICSKLTQLILDDIIAHSNDQLSVLNRAIERVNQINTLGQFGGGFGFGRDIFQLALDKMKERVNDLKIVDKLLKRLENLEIDSKTSLRLLTNAEILRKNLRQSTSDLRKHDYNWRPSTWPPGTRSSKPTRSTGNNTRTTRPPVYRQRYNKEPWYQFILDDDSGCLGTIIVWGGIALFFTLVGSC